MKSVSPLAEVAGLFFRLGCTAFGGPAAHIALIERECVQRRAWITRQRFLDLLGVANLIPGPTSTELAMHVGRQRAGWPGLVVAGLAFIVPGALIVGVLAAIYQRAGDLPIARGVADAVKPVVIVLVLQALVPLGRGAIRSVPMAMVAIAVALMAAVGIPEIRILLFAGVAHMIVGRTATVTAAALVLIAPAAVAAAGAAAGVSLGDLAAYFLRTGSLLFGSGYVLLPVIEGDLVQRQGWLTQEQLLDAIAAGQATPGPVFTTATFIGYLLGGPWAAFVATTAMFLPAFVFSALSSVSSRPVDQLACRPRVPSRRQRGSGCPDCRCADTARHDGVHWPRVDHHRSDRRGHHPLHAPEPFAGAGGCGCARRSVGRVAVDLTSV